MASEGSEAGPLSRVWESKYSERRSERLYKAEDPRVSADQSLFHSGNSLLDLLENGDIPSLTRSFLRFSRDCLEAPSEHTDVALRRFLAAATRQELQSNQLPAANLAPKTIMLDDRRDPEVGRSTTRRWDGPGGYLEYPPEGVDVWPEQAIALSLSDFLSRLKESRYEKKAERRIIYISDITASCMVAIAATAAERSIADLREFFSGLLLFRTVFRISLDATFALEFHIPFLALRVGNSVLDRRELGGKQLRNCRVLPLPREQEKTSFYYESQVSFLAVGIDEWLWTAYCCVDNFYGKETYRKDCLDYKLDPASGGSLWLNEPVWNPRQYFLAILSRRMKQAMWEWTALVNCFIDRLDYYETSFSILDDEKMTRTRELSIAVSCLREFRDNLSSTVRAWDNFESNYINLFEAPKFPKLQDLWLAYVVQIRVSVFRLKDLQALMSQKLDRFNSMRDGLVNASALKESAEATRQGSNIGILTRMTVLYLPLSLATAVFSVAMLPQSNWLWFGYGVLLCSSIVATVSAARRPALLDLIFAAEQSKSKSKSDHAAGSGTGTRKAMGSDAS